LVAVTLVTKFALSGVYPVITVAVAFTLYPTPPPEAEASIYVVFGVTVIVG
jgi:hypothetical protein